MKLPLIFVLCCASAVAQTDGPAILPLTVPSTVAVSPNTPRSIGAGENLQDAINAAACGDVLNVDNTTSWAGSLSVVPTAPCDSGHWLTVQSASPVSLDIRTNRVIPGQQLPKIVLSAQNAHVALGSFVRLAGFEITRTQGTGIVYNLMLPQTGAHDIILDMIYAHGTPQDETNRGISLSDSSNVAIINSFFSDFHCRAISGSCGDSQAVAGGTDSVSGGSYLVRNNVLEAAGQSFMLGGGGSADVPADVTVQGNSLRKQLEWNPADSSYTPTAGKDGVGHPWIVKNCLELKNAQRVLIENNTCENVWGGFTQLGFAFLLTAKNQAGANGTSVCPICSVHDITIRYNRVSHSCAAMQIGLGPNDLGAYATSQYNISIHDLVFDDLNDPDLYQCGHWLLQLSSGATPAGQVMHDVTLSHLTLNVPKWHGPNGPTDGKYDGFLTFGGPLSPVMYNIHFDNNLVPAGNAPIITTGGGSANCAYTAQGNPLTIIPTCWAGTSSFSNNTILTNGYTGTLKWPDTTTLSPVGANVNLVP